MYNTFISDMRISSAQVDTMVTFMEKHGDIGKSTANKVQLVRNWSKLTDLLNSVPVGEKYAMNKWQEAWSSFKSNIKHKAEKHQHAASNTNGGQDADNAKITDIEERVLKLMEQSTENIDDVEENTTQENNEIKDSDIVVCEEELLPPTRPVSPLYDPTITFVDLDSPGPSEVECNHVGTSKQEHDIIQRKVSPATPASSIADVRAGTFNNRYNSRFSNSRVFRRRNNRNNWLAFSRVYPQRNVYGAEETDRFYNYIKEKVRADNCMEKERLRLKEMELHIQHHWQQLAVKAVDVLCNIIGTNPNNQ